MPKKKTRANEESENEGEAHAVTAIPIQPSFPPTQQCHYSANNQPSPYPPPSHPQRPSLNQPQSLPTALPMTNTTFSINQNTKKEMNFAVKKPVEFTPIPVSYANLLPYLLDNSMVAITLTKVHQPPFLREYDSNAACACHGEAPGHSIEHCRALKRKVQGLIDASWLKFEENCVCRNLPFGGRATRDSRDACSTKGIRAESPPTFIWGKRRKNRKRRDLRTFKWKARELYLRTGKVLAPHTSVTRDGSL